MRARSSTLAGGSSGSSATVVAILIAVALAGLAIVLALAALRNMSSDGVANGRGNSGESQDTARQPAPPVQVPPAHPGWIVPDPAFPGYPTPPYPSVRPGHRVLDVRVHNSTPPPIHPFAIAAGEPFAQVGIVYSLENDKRYPLFSRQAPYRKHRYQYYISTDNSSIQIAARAQGRDCGEELGCEELFTGDTISVPELGASELTVKLFSR